MSIGKLLKQIAPIALSAVAGPAVGAGLGQLFGTSAVNPFISRALTGALTSKLSGGKTISLELDLKIDYRHIYGHANIHYFMGASCIM